MREMRGEVGNKTPVKEMDVTCLIFETLCPPTINPISSNLENKTSGFAVRNTFFHTHWHLTSQEQK